MIKKLKPFHASVVIDTRRPPGLFYIHENGVYVGIDNSAGHAWVEEFTSLRQCKEWLRNPLMPVPSMEWEENGTSEITQPEELVPAAMRQGIRMDIHEADIVLGYLEGHDYVLMADNESRTVRHDRQDGADYSEDIPYSIRDAVMFCQEMNEELLQENEYRNDTDAGYLTRLREDEQILDALLEKNAVASGQYMGTVSCPESRIYPAA